MPVGILQAKHLISCNTCWYTILKKRASLDLAMLLRAGFPIHMPVFLSFITICIHDQMQFSLKGIKRF